MMKRIADFKVPAVKRAIRVAHSQQLPDGTIHVQPRDYEVDAPDRSTFGARWRL